MDVVIASLVWIIATGWPTAIFALLTAASVRIALSQEASRIAAISWCAAAVFASQTLFCAHALMGALGWR